MFYCISHDLTDQFIIYSPPKLHIYLPIKYYMLLEIGIDLKQASAIVGLDSSLRFRFSLNNSRLLALHIN